MSKKLYYKAYTTLEIKKKMDVKQKCGVFPINMPSNQPSSTLQRRFTKHLRENWYSYESSPITSTSIKWPPRT